MAKATAPAPTQQTTPPPSLMSHEPDTETTPAGLPVTDLEHAADVEISTDTAATTPAAGEEAAATSTVTTSGKKTRAPRKPSIEGGWTPERQYGLYVSLMGLAPEDRTAENLRKALATHEAFAGVEVNDIGVPTLRDQINRLKAAFIRKGEHGMASEVTFNSDQRHRPRVPVDALIAFRQQLGTPVPVVEATAGGSADLESE